MSEKVANFIMRRLSIPIFVFIIYGLAIVLSEKIFEKLGFINNNITSFIFIIVTSSILAFIFTFILHLFFKKIIDELIFRRWYHYTHLLFLYISGLIVALSTIEPLLIEEKIITTKFSSNFHFTSLVFFIILSNYYIYNSIFINDDFKIFNTSENYCENKSTKIIDSFFIIKILISGTAIIIMTLHIIWPNLAIDSITITLLILAMIPWVINLLKTIELPGGLKIELNEIKRIDKEANRLGLIANELETDTEYQYSFQTIAEQDPNLALAGLRIEIERKLRQIANENNIMNERMTFGRLLKNLCERRLISNEERSVLNDLVVLLNKGAHGAVVDNESAEWAVEIGPRILATLGKRVAHGV